MTDQHGELLAVSANRHGQGGVDADGPVSGRLVVAQTLKDSTDLRLRNCLLALGSKLRHPPRRRPGFPAIADLGAAHCRGMRTIERTSRPRCARYWSGASCRENRSADCKRASGHR